ncbi:MAG: hypothetical protein QHH19_03640 [Candidatus Thermoplasmatota archaeon]|jgi:hypothetical protein|nr:hypothetical protein [Candidatus Thermoplasmatota archaeon]
MGLFGPDKITLMLEKYSYKPGETIKGTVKLNLKKSTKARKLEVGLFGERKERTRSHDGKTHTRTVTVFNFKIPLGAEGEYLTGEYPFEIPIPNNILSIDTRQNMDPRLGAVVDTISMLSGQRVYPVEWFVKSQLDVPMMFDVKKEQKIIIIQ